MLAHNCIRRVIFIIAQNKRKSWVEGERGRHRLHHWWRSALLRLRFYYHFNVEEK